MYKFQGNDQSGLFFCRTLSWFVSVVVHCLSWYPDSWFALFPDQFSLSVCISQLVFDFPQVTPVFNQLPLFLPSVFPCTAHIAFNLFSSCHVFMLHMIFFFCFKLKVLSPPPLFISFLHLGSYDIFQRPCDHDNQNYHNASNMQPI